MIFNEVYGCYYNTVAKIIEAAINGVLDSRNIYDIVRENAFEESSLTIVPSLLDEKWQLIGSDYKTPIKNKPTMPLTLDEKRWLKTIMLDPRARLFDLPIEGLDGIEPFYNPGDIVYFDRYANGDDYENPVYVQNFKTILKAVKEQKRVRINFWNGHGRQRNSVYSVRKIEYSERDDRFRAIAVSGAGSSTININRVMSAEIVEEQDCGRQLPEREVEKLIFDLTDIRNTLERVLMKFSNYKKSVERTGDNTYHVEMEYSVDDEADVLIQIMSFGTTVKVTAPDVMVNNIKERIKKQLEIMKW